jgi:hypothetical protein
VLLLSDEATVDAFLLDHQALGKCQAGITYSDHAATAAAASSLRITAVLSRLAKRSQKGVVDPVPGPVVVSDTECFLVAATGRLPLRSILAIPRSVIHEECIGD